MPRRGIDRHEQRCIHHRHDITSGPTEDDENLDAPGEHSKDSGDEPTEDDENRRRPR